MALLATFAADIVQNTSVRRASERVNTGSERATPCRHATNIRGQPEFFWPLPKKTPPTTAIVTKTTMPRMA
jgi:hypothetical protein